MDLKSAFDSENQDRESLWLLLRIFGVADRLDSLMQALYTDTPSCIHVNDVYSHWFEVLGGVRQGCAVAADLFWLQ